MFAAPRSRLFALVLVALAVCAALAVVRPVEATTTTDPHLSDPAHPCGGTALVSDGHVWRCTLDDEFTSSRINPANWTVVDATQRFNRFHSGLECYVNRPRNIAVTGGSLVLTVTHELRATNCAGRVSHYLSGMLTSRKAFAQAYGRFAFRARLPEGAALQPALWLYPAEPQSPWPVSGEIDVAEYFGNYPGHVSPHLHYIDSTGRKVHPGDYCTVANIGTRFHTYAVEWTPTSMRFLYDGRTCTTIRDWRPRLPLLSPAPFDKPFVINLELALIRSTNGGFVPRTAFPARMYVDWVRVWR